VAFFRGIDGSDPARPEPIQRLGGTQEERRVGRTSLLASGTLACPECDAPVAPGPTAIAPSDPLSCPVCLHGGAVRDFLTLGEPTRPARVDVWLVRRPAAA
jgi:hypothetical protein